MKTVDKINSLIKKLKSEDKEFKEKFKEEANQFKEKQNLSTSDIEVTNKEEIKGLKYKDIYDSSFLDIFENKNIISELILSENKYYIDIDKILELCDIKSFYTEENGANFKKRYLFINKTLTLVDQNYYKAIELGSFFFEYPIIEQIRGRHKKYIRGLLGQAEAGEFAKELLMPEKVVRKALEKTMLDLGYDLNDRFSEQDIYWFTKLASEKMKVPHRKLDNRVKELDIFAQSHVYSKEGGVT